MRQKKKKKKEYLNKVFKKYFKNDHKLLGEILTVRSMNSYLIEEHDGTECIMIMLGHGHVYFTV